MINKEMNDELIELQTYFKLKEYKPLILNEGIFLVINREKFKQVKFYDRTLWMHDEKIYDINNMTVFGDTTVEQIAYKRIVFNFIDNFLVMVGTNFHVDHMITHIAYSFNEGDNNFYTNLQMDDNLKIEMDFVSKWVFNNKT